METQRGTTSSRAAPPCYRRRISFIARFNAFLAYRDLAMSLRTAPDASCPLCNGRLLFLWQPIIRRLFVIGSMARAVARTRASASRGRMNSSARFSRARSSVRCVRARRCFLLSGRVFGRVASLSSCQTRDKSIISARESTRR